MVYRPLKGEVLDGVVSGVERVGLEVRVGACKAFIPHTKIPSDMKYSEERQSFVSDEDPTNEIKVDTIIRFKVENVSIKGQEGAAILVGPAHSSQSLGRCPKTSSAPTVLIKSLRVIPSLKVIIADVAEARAREVHRRERTRPQAHGRKARHAQQRSARRRRR